MESMESVSAILRTFEFLILLLDDRDAVNLMDDLVGRAML